MAAIYTNEFDGTNIYEIDEIVIYGTIKIDFLLPTDSFSLFF